MNLFGFRSNLGEIYSTGILSFFSRFSLQSQYLLQREVFIKLRNLILKSHLLWCLGPLLILFLSVRKCLVSRVEGENGRHTECREIF